MSYYKVRTNKQLQQLSNKHKALRDQIRSENDAELVSTEDKLYDVGKIFRPLLEESITQPLKQMVSDAAPLAATPSAAAVEAAPSRAALTMSTPPQGRPFQGTSSLLQLTPRAARTVQIDIDKALDTELIRKHKFPLPSELLEHNIPDDQIQGTIALAKHRNKMLGQQKKGKDELTKQALSEEINMIRNYYDRLTMLVQSKEVTVGTGLPLQSKNLLHNSQLGNLKIKFNGNTMQAFDSKTGDLVLEEIADDSLFDLLTKKYYKNKKYTKDALLTYAKLIDLAFGTGKIPRNKKMNLVNRLRLLLASKQAGNTGIDDEIKDLIK